MSEISEAARVHIGLADVAIEDPAGKLNMLGGGVLGLGFDAQQGLTAPFTLIVEFYVSGAMTPTQFTAEITLRGSDGKLVELPGPTQPQVMRVAQIVDLEPPSIPGGASLARKALDARAQIILNFSNGLPLTPGTAYQWSVQIDGDEENRPDHRFAVMGSPTAPVIG